MSSSKLKKKSKSTRIPEPIKIKKEDDHLVSPMEHYVDDRVELIRQIFSSLKPKTITNLAPDFLKKKSIEEIQEQCLNEILGISKKRLLSIINSTKCPTDTETSSEDDVNAVTEHISLEEISSDSDIMESKLPKVVVKKKRKVKQETGNNKQFSVLELLELQARARAIRSQLALEPVTKIEVDTDSDEDGPPRQKPPAAPSVLRKKSSKATNGSSVITKSDAGKKAATSTLTVIIPNGEPAPAQRIKLKRNFRKQPRDDEESNFDAEVSHETPANILPKNEARSPSPEVVPIVSVPETLCISDSDEETKNSKIAKNDDEVSQSATKSCQQLEILSVVNINIPLKNSESENPATSDPSKQSTSCQQIGQPESEEEGEIVDKEEVPVSSNKIETATVEENSLKTDKDEDISNQPADNREPSATSTKENNDPTHTEENVAPKGEDDQKPQKVENLESEDDDNDDVISLEGGDVVNEMKEHMEDDVLEATQDDIICLGDSSEEEAKTKKKTESWNDRWLNSRRVSKVLAASRLGNKVRNKIKQNKKAKKLEAAAAIEKEQEKNQQVVFISKHELGSVDQYKEILESLPKKSTD